MIKNPYMKQFLRRLQFEKNYSLNTIQCYHADLLELEQYLSQHNINVINMEYDHIFDYFINLQQINSFSAKSISRKISCLRSFFKHLELFEITSSNPMQQITLPKLAKKLPNIISEQELNHIFDFFDHSDDNFATIRDAMIFELLYSCGLRVSELCQLTLNNIYLDEEFIRVLGKGNKERLIPMGRRLLALIKKYLPIRYEYLKGINCDFVITSKFRKHVSRMFIWKVINKYAQQLNTTDLHPHMLRHAFASHMLAYGADLRIIQELLGHSSISTTEIYTHVTTQHLKEIVTTHHPLSLHHHL